MTAIEKLLQKHVSREHLEALDEICSSMQSPKPRVANFGLLKAGKSTLFNCLSDCFDDSNFKTGSVRTTIKSQEMELEDYILIDTPGLDCQDDDSEKTFKALKGADICIFVHNLRTGELDSLERKFLQELAANWGDVSDFVERTFWVTSFEDEQPDSELVCKAIRKQLRNVFEYDVDIHRVASKRYLSGKLQNKKLFVEKSNIPMLQNELSKKISKIAEDLEFKREKKNASCVKKIMKELSSKIADTSDRINAAQNKRQILAAKLKRDITRLMKQTQSQIENYKTI